MSRYVTVRLTVPQAEALDNAAAFVQSGEADGWTTQQWNTLGRARDILVNAIRATDRRPRSRRGRRAEP